MDPIDSVRQKADAIITQAKSGTFDESSSLMNASLPESTNSSGLGSVIKDRTHAAIFMAVLKMHDTPSH